MDFDGFVQTAWVEHGEHAQGVADRLRDSLAIVATPEQVAPYAALVAHVFGEHLGQWDAGIALLKALRDLPAGHASPLNLGTLARHEAALRCASGDTPPFDALPNDHRVAALASAASMLAGRAEWARAIGALEGALRGAVDGLPVDSPAHRALAVAGNNLAAAFEEKTERSAEQTRAMLMAARAGLQYWRIAGTWLEEERAEYRLARSCLQAGGASSAIASAQRCLAICEANQAPALERFFGHAVLALAQRTAGDATAFSATREQARGWFERVAADEKAWCEGELAELAPLDSQS